MGCYWGFSFLSSSAHMVGNFSSQSIPPQDVNAFDIAVRFCHWGNVHHLSLLSCVENIDLTEHGKQEKPEGVSPSPFNLVISYLKCCKPTWVWEMKTAELLSVWERLILGVQKEDDLHGSYLGSKPMTIFPSCHRGLKRQRSSFCLELGWDY